MVHELVRPAQQGPRVTLCHPVTGLAPGDGYPLVGGRAGEFGWSRRERNGAPRFHRGVDFAMFPGDTFFASHDGKVTRVGEQSAGKGYGQRIYLKGFHGEQLLFTIYAHLSVQFVSLGEIVRAGHCLGLAGRSGNITTEETHLHHEVRLGGEGKNDAVNPLWFYDERNHQRLGVPRPGGE